MGAAKGEKLQVQLVGTRNIRIEADIQSRAGMSPPYIHEFSDAILRGATFPPIDVFWDGNTYWLADGFHRIEAHRKAGVLDIRCTIHYGTRSDAIIHSAGANQKFSIPRSGADKRRAVFMLCADPDWFNRTAEIIGRHVGVGPMYAKKYRREFCLERGIDEPQRVLDELGRERPAKTCKAYTGPLKRPPSLGGRFRVRAGGKNYSLGSSRKDAEEKRFALLEIAGAGAKNRMSIFVNSLNFMDKMAELGVTCKPCGNRNNWLGTSWISKTAIFVVSRLESADDFHAAVGRAVLNHNEHFPTGRTIIISYGIKKRGAFDLLRRFGIELMTPEEFAASVQATPPTPNQQ